MNLSKTNLLFAYLYIICALAFSIVYYMKPKKLSFDMDLYRYRLEDQKSDGSVNVTGEKEISINTKTIQILVVSMLSVAGLFGLFYSTNGFYTKAYSNAIKNRVNKYRWFELSITSSIVAFVISILSGLKDYNTVILISVLTGAMMCIGFFIEKSRRVTDKTIGLVAFCGILATILSLIYNSLIIRKNEDKNFPEWIVGTLVGVGVWLILLCFLTIVCAGGFGKNGFDYPTYDKYYTYLGFILKAYFSGYITYGILSS